MLTKPAIQCVEVEGEILDTATLELDVVPPDPVPDLPLVPARQGQHVGVHVHTDHFVLGTYDLAGDETDLPRAGPEVQHGFAIAKVSARIPATVILYQDLFGNDLEILLVVVYWAAQLGFPTLGPVAITLGYCPLYIE